MNSYFVTVHGIDGVGKTTAAETLASMMRQENDNTYTYAQLLETEPSFLTQERELREELVGDTDDTSVFQKSVYSKLAQSAIVREALNQDMSVVRDRWYIDVLAANSYKGGSVSIDAEVLVPDLSVILVCNEEERMRRIHDRSDPTEDDLIPKVPGTRAHYFENFLLKHTQDLCGNFMILDTTEVCPTEIANRIIGELHE